MFLRDRAGDEQSVGVARRGDELDAEAAEIPADGAEHVGVGLAGVAAAGADLPQPQRAAEELAQFFVERGGQADLFLARLAEQEVFAAAHGHAMVAGLGDGPGGTGLDARGAEDAAAQIERDGLPGGARDGLGRDRPARRRRSRRRIWRRPPAARRRGGRAARGPGLAG